MTSVRELTDEPIIKLHDDAVMYCPGQVPISRRCSGIAAKTKGKCRALGPWDWNYITDGDWYCHRHKHQDPR